MNKDVIKGRFIVRQSRPGMGRGLFAAMPIRKGDFLLEYTGRRIPTSYADTLKTRYLFELDESWTIDGSRRTNIARHVNHSCVPNCEVRLRDGKILIFAARNIQRGEELAFDYGDEYFEEFIRPSGCKCTRCMSRDIVHA